MLLFKSREGRSVKTQIYSPIVRPIHASWAQKEACAFVMKAAVGLDVSRESRNKGLAFGCDPVKYGALQCLRVIRSSAGCPFLNLRRHAISVQMRPGQYAVNVTSSAT